MSLSLPAEPRACFGAVRSLRCLANARDRGEFTHTHTHTHFLHTERLAQTLRRLEGGSRTAKHALSLPVRKRKGDKGSQTIPNKHTHTHTHTHHRRARAFVRIGGGFLGDTKKTWILNVHFKKRPGYYRCKMKA